MNGITILAIFLILWGAATLLVGILRPKALWELGKIQGFVTILTARGTTIFFTVIGLLALAGGVALLLN